MQKQVHKLQQVYTPSTKLSSQPMPSFPSSRVTSGQDSRRYTSRYFGNKVAKLLSSVYTCGQREEQNWNTMSARVSQKAISGISTKSSVRTQCQRCPTVKPSNKSVVKMSARSQLLWWEALAVPTPKTRMRTCLILPEKSRVGACVAECAHARKGDT